MALTFDFAFDRWAALAFVSYLTVVLLVALRAGRKPTWETFRPVIAGFALAALMLLRGLRAGKVEVGTFVLAAIYLGNLAYRVSAVPGASWRALDWHTRWVVLAPAAMFVVVVVSSIVVSFLSPPASTRVMEAAGLFMVTAAVAALLDPRGPDGSGAGWREYGTLLVPAGAAGLILSDDKALDKLCLGAAGLGVCFLADMMVRGRAHGEIESLAPLGLRLRHDGTWLSGEAEGVRLRFKHNDSYWDLEMEAEVAAGSDFQATNATIPLEVPLSGFLPGHREIAVPPSWDGYRVFAVDGPAARAALESAPAPRPIPRLLSRSGRALLVRWEVSDAAASTPAAFRLLLAAVSALARRWN